MDKERDGEGGGEISPAIFFIILTCVPERGDMWQGARMWEPFVSKRILLLQLSKEYAFARHRVGEKVGGRLLMLLLVISNLELRPSTSC